MTDNNRGSVVAALARGCVCLLLLVGAGPAATAAQEPDTPDRVVRALHEQLLDVMQRAQELGYQGRYAALENCINRSFDFPRMTNVILGRQRQALDAGEIAAFADLLARLSVATYASRFDGYAGEEFVEIARKPARRGRVLIQTELRRLTDEPVTLEYLLHEQSGSWRIISVIANGVNDLSLKRAEYVAVIKKQGYTGLVEEIEAKIRTMGDGS